MKLLLVFAFLALICVAKSVPTPTSSARALILPEYSNYEVVLDDEIFVTDADDEEDEASPSTTTTTTSTRRSTSVFPTRTPYTFSRRTQRTTTVDHDDDDHENEDGHDYFKNIREMFKKVFEDVKKFFRKITGNDLVKTVLQYFTKQDDDDD